MKMLKRLRNYSVNVMTAYTYILQCSNGEYYVGSTTDLEARLNEHQAGMGGKYTSTHLPVKLVYFEEYSSIHLAFSRERQLHGWSRAKKEALIRGDYEALRPLSLPKGLASAKDLALATSTASKGSATNKEVGVKEK